MRSSCTVGKNPSLEQICSQPSRQSKCLKGAISGEWRLAFLLGSRALFCPKAVFTSSCCTFATPWAAPAALGGVDQHPSYGAAGCGDPGRRFALPLKPQAWGWDPRGRCGCNTALACCLRSNEVLQQPDIQAEAAPAYRRSLSQHPLPQQEASNDPAISTFTVRLCQTSGRCVCVNAVPLSSGIHEMT